MRWPFQVPHLCEIPQRWGDSAAFKERIVKCIGDAEAEPYFIRMVQLERAHDLGMRQAVIAAVLTIKAQLTAVGC